jgi:hypothetical protein
LLLRFPLIFVCVLYAVFMDLSPPAMISPPQPISTPRNYSNNRTADARSTTA